MNKEEFTKTTVKILQPTELIDEVKAEIKKSYASLKIAVRIFVQRSDKLRFCSQPKMLA